MGDRGNIAIVQHPNEDPTEDRGIIFFYGHWSGYRLEASLAQALEHGRERWGDESYLGRIIFCQFLVGDPNESDPMSVVNTTTGFGVSTYLTDNEYLILVVDDRQQKVFKVTEGIAREMAKGQFSAVLEDPDQGESFEDFMAHVRSEADSRV